MVRRRPQEGSRCTRLSGDSPDRQPHPADNADARRTSRHRARPQGASARNPQGDPERRRTPLRMHTRRDSGATVVSARQFQPPVGLPVRRRSLFLGFKIQDFARSADTIWSRLRLACVRLWSIRKSTMTTAMTPTTTISSNVMGQSYNGNRSTKRKRRIVVGY